MNIHVILIRLLLVDYHGEMVRLNYRLAYPNPYNLFVYVFMHVNIV